jgi:hypothetical protein
LKFFAACFSERKKEGGGIFAKILNQFHLSSKKQKKEEKNLLKFYELQFKPGI